MGPPRLAQNDRGVHRPPLWSLSGVDCALNGAISLRTGYHWAAAGAANASVTGVLGAGPGGTMLLVVGTVLFTGIAGVVFCELRRRSGSLLAPILLHWAVNGFGELLLLVT